MTDLSASDLQGATVAVLKVTGFTCMFVPGLGCGHRIAPVLARLEPLAQDIEVEVDRSGTFVRVTPASRAADVVRAIRSGEEEIVVEALEGRAMEEVIVGATAWFSRANIGDLTREEFRLLAQPWADLVRRTIALNGGQVETLAASIEAAIEEVLTLVPLEDGLPKDPTVWLAARKKAAQRVVEDACAYLGVHEVDALRTVLAEVLAP